MAKDEIARAIKKVSKGNGVLLLTDMFGGTPTNISAMFIEENEVEIVTGVNLPMVIKLASQNKEMTLERNGERSRSAGKTSDLSSRRAARAAKVEKRCLKRKVKIINQLGLHARAAAQLVRLAGLFKATSSLMQTR